MATSCPSPNRQRRLRMHLFQPFRLVVLLLLSSLSRSKSQIGVTICYCSPSTYEFILNFDLTCANSTVGGPGVNDTTCSVLPSIPENVTDFRPVIVTKIQVIELNQNDEPLSITTDDQTYSNGDTFRYSSVVGSQNASTLPAENVVRGVQLSMAGRNAAEQDLVNFWRIVFDNSCDIFPVVLQGQQIGWTIFGNVTNPPVDFCPLASQPPTLAPTLFPTISPVTAAPVVPPTFVPPTFVPTTPPVSVAPAGPTQAPAVGPTKSPETKSPTKPTYKPTPLPGPPSCPPTTGKGKGGKGKGGKGKGGKGKGGKGKGGKGKAKGSSKQAKMKKTKSKMSKSKSKLKAPKSNKGKGGSISTAESVYSIYRVGPMSFSPTHHGTRSRVPTKKMYYPKSSTKGKSKSKMSKSKMSKSKMSKSKGKGTRSKGKGKTKSKGKGKGVSPTARPTVCPEPHGPTKPSSSSKTSQKSKSNKRKPTSPHKLPKSKLSKPTSSKSKMPTSSKAPTTSSGKGSNNNVRSPSYKPSLRKPTTTDPPPTAMTAKPTATNHGAGKGSGSSSNAGMNIFGMPTMSMSSSSGSNAPSILPTPASSGTVAGNATNGGGYKNIFGAKGAAVLESQSPLPSPVPDNSTTAGLGGGDGGSGVPHPPP